MAVIDEIQQIRDPQRGWAWTRAFLGLIADEVHVCGEPGALDLLQKICETTNETVEVRRYDRLTELTVESTALGSLDNVVAGDCIVCFSKHDIYTVSREIEARSVKLIHIIQMISEKSFLEVRRWPLYMEVCLLAQSSPKPPSLMIPPIAAK